MKRLATSVFLLLALDQGCSWAADLKVVASTYTDKYIATGARFNPEKMAAAHKTWPFGSKWTLRLWHRSIVVEINDRGPYIRGRTLDLTPAANKALRCGGLCRVKVESWPPLPKPRPVIEHAIAWGEE